MQNNLCYFRKFVHVKLSNYQQDSLRILLYLSSVNTCMRQIVVINVRPYSSCYQLCQVIRLFDSTRNREYLFIVVQVSSGNTCIGLIALINECACASISMLGQIIRVCKAANFKVSSCTSCSKIPQIIRVCAID